MRLSGYPSNSQKRLEGGAVGLFVRYPCVRIRQEESLIFMRIRSAIVKTWSQRLTFEMCFTNRKIWCGSENSSNMFFFSKRRNDILLQILRFLQGHHYHNSDMFRFDHMCVYCGQFRYRFHICRLVFHLLLLQCLNLLSISKLKQQQNLRRLQ